MKIKKFNEMYDVDFANTIADAIEQEKVGGYRVRELKSDNRGLGD